MHMHGTIKKKLQLHTYMDSNYTLSLSLSLLFLFVYTHEFTPFFPFLFIEFLMIYLY